MRTACLVLFLSAAGAVAAPPTLAFPETTVKAQAGEFVVLRPETTGKWVRYKALTPGLSVFPSSELKNPKNTVVTAPRDGTYKVLAWTGTAEEGSDPVEVTLVIGTGKKADDKADGKKDDVPPPDSFVATLRDAAKLDGATPDQLLGLAAAWKSTANRASAKSGDGQAYLADTWGSLFAHHKAAVAAADVAGKATAVQKACGAGVRAIFRATIDTDPLPADRAAVTAAFARIADALAESAK